MSAFCLHLNFFILNILKIIKSSFSLQISNNIHFGVSIFLLLKKFFYIEAYYLNIGRNSPLAFWRALTTLHYYLGHVPRLLSESTPMSPPQNLISTRKTSITMVELISGIRANGIHCPCPVERHLSSNSILRNISPINKRHAIVIQHINNCSFIDINDD